jgi:hypothetical protein
VVSGEVGVGERTGDALGDIWLARGAAPLSRRGGLRLAPLDEGAFLLCGDLTPRSPFVIAGGGVFGLGGRFAGAEGIFCLEVAEVCEAGKRLADDSLFGRMRGWPPLRCRLASRVSIFMELVEGGGGGKFGLGARERDLGGETFLLGEGDLDLLSCAPTNPVKSS